LRPRSISGTLAQMIAFLQTVSVTYTAPVHWNGFDDMFISVSYPTQTANSSQVRRQKIHDKNEFYFHKEKQYSGLEHAKSFSHSVVKRMGTILSDRTLFFTCLFLSFTRRI
jgi:hypothetical protein